MIAHTQVETHTHYYTATRSIEGQCCIEDWRLFSPFFLVTLERNPEMYPTAFQGRKEEKGKNNKVDFIDNSGKMDALL